MKQKLLSALLATALLVSLAAPSCAAAQTMAFSDALVTYIKNGEGFRTKPYSDGTGWYIGYGVACGQYDYPNGITESEAEALLRQKMQLFADAVNAFLTRYGVAVTQGQFDAMCGLSYNIGTSWLNARNRLPGYLIDGIENHSAREIADAIGVYCHVGSSVYEPLLRRRVAELKMFLSDDYSATADGWCWLILNANGGENADFDVALFPAGEPYGALPVPTRAGWYFAGWQTADGKVLKNSDTAGENLRVTALWSETPVEQPEPEPEPEPDPDARFSDVAAGDWFYDYVETLAAGGVVSGYPDGSFRPERDVTYGEALKLLLRAAGFAEQTAEDDEHWAAAYLRYAVSRSYLAEGAVTDLDAPITRDAVADLTAAALELPSSAIASPYADSSRPSALALYEAGIMQGSVDTGVRLFNGGDALRRSEVCVILCGVLDYVAENFVFVSGLRAPVDHSLRCNSYDTAAFRTEENGRITYSGTDTTVRFGIDVSEHQGVIDWAAVAADGVEFAMIRCGWRGYGSTAGLNEDKYFRANIEGALAAGLDVGVYFFSQALTEAEAREEAAYTLELIAGYDLTFPVVFDWEQVAVRGSRTLSPDWAAVTDCTEVFCDAVAAAGYTPMTYFNMSMAYLRLDLSRLQKYHGWLAWYHEVPEYRYEYRMWQYGALTTVAGVKGLCDVNLLFGEF